MIAMSVNLNGDGALAHVRRVEEASEIEVLLLDGGMSSGHPSVTIHITLPAGVGETAKSERHIVAQTSARLFCTAAKMIEARHPDLYVSTGAGMSGGKYRKPMVPKGQPSRLTVRQQLKHLDAISFDELGDFLSETVHTGFRKGTDCPEAHKVWVAMRAMPRDQWSAAFDWMIWALRASTGREKKP